jgi:hypothetical protein
LPFIEQRMRSLFMAKRLFISLLITVLWCVIDLSCIAAASMTSTPDDPQVLAREEPWQGAGDRLAQNSWFKEGALFLFLMILLAAGALVYSFQRARAGKSFYIRPIPGLNAVEEAVGCATELGKPIFYCSGVAPLSCPGVLASLIILGWVAEKTARYGAQLTYPVNNALNLTAGQEIVKESYLRAGKPEQYDEDMVYFISGEQFAYAAAVCGVMERERPAANFFFGSFWSEALILTESGATTNAIQIAATDSEHQLPFMVATCDHVIIGEEFFAASAYLSDDPQVKASLKAQDIVKAVLLLLIIAGVTLNTLHEVFGWDVEGFFEFFRR